jgi:hypothetical protein
MSAATPLPDRICDISVINIPNVAEALSVMKKEILNVTLLLPEIQNASTELAEEIAHFTDTSAHSEATALKESVHKLEVAMSEIQERIVSLESVLNRKATIPAILTTPDAISGVFHIAVNGSTIDWPLAEAVLERFLDLWTEEIEYDYYQIEQKGRFGKFVWRNNNFCSNVAQLLRGGDCWRVRKSLELITSIVWDACDFTGNAEMFNSLASIILQPRPFYEVDTELKWIFLIEKNQEKPMNNDIVQLINSFLYSREGKNTIFNYVLNTICGFICDEGSEGSNQENIIIITDETDVPEALIIILFTEKRNTDVISHCLDVIYNLVKFEVTEGTDIREMVCQKMERCLDYHAIWKALFSIIEIYINDENKIANVVSIILNITKYGTDIENAEDIADLGLLKALVPVFDAPYHNNPYHFEDLKNLVQILLEYDSDVHQKLYGLGSGSIVRFSL